MTSSPHKVYAGVDWITLTTGPDDDAQLAYDKCRALAVEQEGEGDRARPWSAHGYKGFGTPHLRCGGKEGDVLVELSGHLANKYWREFLPLARNVSRFDTCVDVELDPKVRDLAVDAFNAPPVRLRPGLPVVKKYLFQGGDNGQTCYVGAPSSDRRGRLYDKYVESRGEFPIGTWRYEVQERRHMGSTVSRALDREHDVHSAVAAHVRHFFSQRGVEPWFLADDRDLSTQPRRSRPDLQQFCNWLHLQVRPGIGRWRDLGHTAAIRSALDLAGEAEQ